MPTINFYGSMTASSKTYPAYKEGGDKQLIDLTLEGSTGTLTLSLFVECEKVPAVEEVLAKLIALFPPPPVDETPIEPPPSPTVTNLDDEPF